MLIEKYSNFRLADLVTIMNGVCGAFSIFSSARYLLTNDVDVLYAALAYPLAGLMFDFLDGKVARWRKESSMLGQELDSLADLVSMNNIYKFISILMCLLRALDFIRSRTCFTGICRGPSDISGYCSPDWIHLLWACSTSALQRNRGVRP